MINGLTTESLALILEAGLAVVVGLVIALCFSWRIALVCIALSPTTFLGAYIMARLQWKPKGMSTANSAEIDTYQESNALLSDIILNYRTVISFGQKNIDHLMSNFDRLLVAPKR